MNLEFAKQIAGWISLFSFLSIWVLIPVINSAIEGTKKIWYIFQSFFFYLFLQTGLIWFVLKIMSIMK